MGNGAYHFEVSAGGLKVPTCRRVWRGTKGQGEVTTWNIDDKVRVSVAKGNSKLGASILAWSLPSCRTCTRVVNGVASIDGAHAPCTVKCYDRKAWCQYGFTRAARTRNLVSLRASIGAVFDGLHEILSKGAVKFFRIHAAGDFRISADRRECQEYLGWWARLARLHSEVQFLAFTKCYWLDFADVPSNLTIVRSAWPGLEMDAERPCGVSGDAWLEDPEQMDERIPDTAVLCPGSCDTCHACWFIGKIEGNATKFAIH